MADVRKSKLLKTQNGPWSHGLPTVFRVCGSGSSTYVWVGVLIDKEERCLCVVQGADAKTLLKQLQVRLKGEDAAA